MRYLFVIILFFTIFVDQIIKDIFVNGYFLETSCINLELHYNKGVAFSMLAFLGDNLKWIQIFLIILIISFFIYEKYIQDYPFSTALILGGAISNLYDRFIHIDGVVDYIFWHCGFNFAIFNYADIMINLGVFLILLNIYIKHRKSKK